MKHHILFLALLLVSVCTVRVDASGPLHHIVLVKFREDLPAAELQTILREFQLLPAKIPGIVGLQWGSDNSPEGLQKGFTHGFFMTFQDAGALESYLPHPAHQALVGILRPAVEKVFVCDFHVDEVPGPAEPGRVRHLVFFKYKETASAAAIAKVNSEFAALPLKIPGLLRLQSGENTAAGRNLSMGMTHAFALTFTHRDARDDYLPHPAHREFGNSVGPVLDDVLVLDFTVRHSGRGLLVTDGLEPYRVYQRDDGNTAKLAFSGLAAGDGPIEARLLRGRRVVAGFDWRQVGEAIAGAFRGDLPGVPAGGEYTIEIRRRDWQGNVAEITSVANLLVGDVWILAGQSNMQGVGNLIDVEPPSPLVHNFTMAQRWELAMEPLHWLGESRDPVHYGGRFKGLDETGRRKKRAAERASRTKGTGLGLPFATHMVRHTGIPVGLISAAHGGTSMSQWDPAKKDLGGESLYGSMIRQVQRAGGRVRGLLWYQGESDSGAESAPLFRERFVNLVAAVRRDLAAADLPFYFVQIGRFVTSSRDAGAWKVVQEAQRTVVAEIPNSAVISVMDLALDDLIHVGTPGLKRAGARLARIARRELFAQKDLCIGPRLAGVEVENGGRTLRIVYGQVNGHLLPAVKVAGFSLRKAAGGELATIYNAAVDPGRTDTVVLKLQSPVPEGATLWYGAGLDPVCNLVDAEDMAALAFGPVTIER